LFANSVLCWTSTTPPGSFWIAPPWPAAPPLAPAVLMSLVHCPARPPNPATFDRSMPCVTVSEPEFHMPPPLPAGPPLLAALLTQAKSAKLQAPPAPPSPAEFPSSVTWSSSRVPEFRIPPPWPPGPPLVDT
jgi:hypothetical protein